MKKKRETLDESTITIDGRSKTLREYLTETEGRSNGLEFSAESAKFLAALPRVRQRERALQAKPKAVYSRRLTPSEIVEEEVKRMAAQADKTLRFLMANPKEWFTSKEICLKIKENPATAAPTVSRVVKFFQATEPDLLRTQQTGRTREMMFMATVDDIQRESELYHQKYLEWLRKYTREQKQARKDGTAPGRGHTAEDTQDKIEYRHEDPVPVQDSAQRLKITVEGSIKILFGFVKGE